MTRQAGTAAAPEARLLVVDDEPNIVELLSMSLRFAGFEVATATNGRDAVGAASMDSGVGMRDIGSSPLGWRLWSADEPKNSAFHK